ncbi:hypothetical protein WKH56_05930 [Priestia sp. SB1]|uniref:hypothetical protein n=1 Tax=Priestia sp. SB1 TaxID=3132359 RepID=UPI00317FFE0E
MKNLSNHLKEKIQEHLKALQLEEIEWLDEQAVVESWKEQKVIAYGGTFLLIALNTGVVLEFSYMSSQGTQYCNCKNTDEGYNAFYNCCGERCDWEVPMVIKNVQNKELEEVFVFTGKQKELW